MHLVGLYAVVLAGIGGIASAQEPVDLPARDADYYLAEFADCAVAQKSNRAPIEAFLRTVPEGPGFYDAGRRATDMHCLDAAARRSGGTLTMRMPVPAYRAALYPALYRRAFAKAGPPAALATVPPLLLSTEFDGDLAQLPASYAPARALGDCVARHAPAAAHALALARPHSKAEAAAVGALKPALAECLPAGQTLRLNRAMLRAYVGEALYKLVRAATPAG